jgi:hypothetical protein
MVAHCASNGLALTMASRRWSPAARVLRSTLDRPYSEPMIDGVYAIDDHVRAAYICGDSPAEVFNRAAQWAARNDGVMAGVKGLEWKRLGRNDDWKFEMSIFFEPNPGV